MITYNTICDYSDEELDEYPNYLDAVRKFFNIPNYITLNLVGVSVTSEYRFQYYFECEGYEVVYMNFHSWKKVAERQNFFKLLNSFDI
jgi:hypothetical protein